MDVSAQRFLFQKRNEKIDWRKFASIDVDKVAREIDVDAIQENIVSVTYCNIEHELGYNDIDPNFVKLYRLAQLMIEYLLHCQDYLQQSLEEKDLNIRQLSETIAQNNVNAENLKNDLNNRNTAYKNLKKEFQKSRKMIGEYQLMIRAGANGLHKCSNCSKSFVSESYLQSHIERRHPDKAKQFHSTKYPLETQSYQDVNLQNELSNIKTRLQMTENQLNRERENFSVTRVQDQEKNMETLEDLRQQNETWRINEQNKMKEELENYKNLMMGELKQTQREKEILQQNVLQLQNNKGKKKSNLGDLMDEDEQITYQDLVAKLQGMEQGLKDKLNLMEVKYKKEENAHNMNFNKRLSQEIEKQERLEQQRLQDKKFYEEQIVALKKKLTEHDIQIEENKKKASLAIDTVDSFPSPKKPSSTPSPQKGPPIPPMRNEPSPVPKANQSSIENEEDSVTLWVSMNQSLIQPSYRVLKNPASVKGGWKDLFSFSTLLQPVGDFQKPIYVYSCPGSPYWRQYVSSSPTPPQQNYKHDLTFYVTTSKLLGTIRLTVLDAGSGSVVRSMICKDDIVPKDWHQKGLSFYVLKATGGGSRKTSYTRSGTLNSDIFDGVSDVDDDDVSVSTITATDVVKNLADDIKRSRENLLEYVDQDKTQEEEETKGELKADDLESKEDNDDDFDEVDANKELQRTQDSQFETSSSSFLNATLPEKGEFYPYEDNPLAVARYKHSEGMLQGQRREMQEILDEHLEKRGVDPDETRLREQVFQNKLKHLYKEQELKEKTFPGFTKFRKTLGDAVDDFSVQKWVKKGGKKAGKRFKQAAGAIRGVVKAVKRSPPREETLPSSPHVDRSSSSNRHTRDLHGVSTADNEKVLMRYQRDDHDADEEDSVVDTENVEDGQDVEDEDDMSGTWNTDEDEDGDDDDDYEDVDHHPQQQQQSPPHHYQTEEPYRPKMRSPKGAKVKELTRSLEASLNNRGGIKKPAGAIDLHHAEDDEDEDGQQHNDNKNVEKPKRSVSFRDQNQYHVNDDVDDDDSDFSVTSFEGSRNSSGTNLRDNLTLEDLNENTGSYRPSSKNSIGKPPAPFSSSTPYASNSRPSSAGGGGSNRTGSSQEQRQNTAVTKFTLEDFDDDDESF